MMLVHPENAYSPKVLSFEGNEIVESEAQFWKHLSGIVVIASGKDDGFSGVVTLRVLIDVIVEFRKAHSPNEVNVEGNSTEVIFLS